MSHQPADWWLIFLYVTFSGDRWGEFAGPGGEPEGSVPRGALCTMPACRFALLKGTPTPPNAAEHLLRKTLLKKQRFLRRWEKNRSLLPSS